jgi:hypothetical protein
MSIILQHANSLDPQPAWTICSWTCQPSVSRCYCGDASKQMLQALDQPASVAFVKLVPIPAALACINTYAMIMALQATSHMGILFKALRAPTLPHIVNKVYTHIHIQSTSASNDLGMYMHRCIVPFQFSMCIRPQGVAQTLCWICWGSCNALFSRSHISTCARIIVSQPIVDIKMSLNYTLCTSSMLPHLAHMLRKLLLHTKSLT